MDCMGDECRERENFGDVQLVAICGAFRRRLFSRSFGKSITSEWVGEISYDLNVVVRPVIGLGQAFIWDEGPLLGVVCRLKPLKVMVAV